MSPVDSPWGELLLTEKKHLYLIGFMGSGKSTLGRMLAEMLNRPFLDLDEEIEREEGMSISRIFAAHGESRFRELETSYLRRLSRSAASVVALGGGAFGSEVNRSEISRTGVSVWLELPVETAWNRCAGDRSRPLARSKEEFTGLFHARIPDFEKADLRVELKDDPPREICRRILEALEARSGVQGRAEE